MLRDLRAGIVDISTEKYSELTSEGCRNIEHQTLPGKAYNVATSLSKVEMPLISLISCDGGVLTVRYAYTASLIIDWTHCGAV